MSYIRYDKFGRSEFFSNISGEDKLRDKKMTDSKLNITAITEQTKLLRSKIRFIEKFTDFQKEINLNEIKDLRETNNSLSESVEAALKGFDISLNNLQLEFNSLFDNSVEATIQILYL